MLNKKLVLGGLAGATLLVGAAIMVPTAAEAAMSGVCNACHTMHNSQGGLAVDAGGPNAQLLIFDGCVGCHTGAANNASGFDTNPPNAPQVGSAASANPLAGGYFSAAANMGRQHDVVGISTGDTILVNAAPNGGAAAQYTAGAQLQCQFCHADAVGGHHNYPEQDVVKTGFDNNSYRMLEPDVNGDGTGDGTYVTSYSGAGNGNDSAIWGYGNADETKYLGAGGLNAFCAACHGGFHGANQASGGDWIRHPTDISITVAGGYTLPSTLAELEMTPVGAATNAGAGDIFDRVMCISCHVPHGSANSDMLRFSYAGQKAGDATETPGCETCHGSK